MELDDNAVRGYFPGLAENVWVNTAHQGAMPVVAESALERCVAEKREPHRISDDAFHETPDRLRRALARLLNADPACIALANSASYGLHLIANAYPWEPGDEILLLKGDFPSDALPWTLQERHGAAVSFIDPANGPLSPETLDAAITKNTRIFCVTWVHSFTGARIDLDALGAVCRRRGVRFVVNGSQALGAHKIDVSRTPVDALVSVGFKWMAGPYATGFCWFAPGRWDMLAPIKAYWLSEMGPEELAGELRLPPPPEVFDPVAHDIFCMANFFNFAPWTAAVELFCEIGMTEIEQRAAALSDAFLAGIDPEIYRFSSACSGAVRSNLHFLAPRRGEPQAIAAALAREGVHVSARSGQIRVSPHFYNTYGDMDAAASALNAAGR